MQYIKKNLTVILLSVMCTLLLVITILLIVNHNTFKFSNSSNKSTTEKENTKEVEKATKQEEVKEIETKEEKNDSKEQVVENKQVEVKKEEPVINTNESKVVEEKNENNLISYFQQEANKFDTNDTSITDKLKASFTSIIDFIFYDKEIKGYTFKELTNTAKLKVISLALTIDHKIDSYFPNYKDKIKDKYNDIKASLATKYLEVTANFCIKDPDTCKQAKEDFEAMKKSFGLTGAKVSEAAKNAGSKIKELYENWR